MKPKRLNPPKSDLTGHRFGRLIVQSWANGGRWNCLCDCGSMKTADTGNLNAGNIQSCGCLRRELSAARRTTHGLTKSGSLAYHAWELIRKRVNAKSGAMYRDYASKGIAMWPGWERDPQAFIAHIGEPPERGMSVDRIDNAKGYEPGNVRWATPLEQANNKTNNRWVEHNGQRVTLSQMIRAVAAETGEKESTGRRRIERQLYS